MSFLNPLLLWGALAAAFPLVIHLWGRRRPRRVQFPSLRLIRAAQQQQRSYLRVRDLLILLLRMLLIALLSLALAGPVVQSGPPASLLQPDRRLAVVIDVSASMARLDGEQSAMDRAIAVARSSVRSLPESTQVDLFEADRHLRPLAGDTDLRRLRPGSSPGDLPGALNRSDVPLLADPECLWLLITDMQATGFLSPLDEPLPQPPVIVDVGSLAPTNHAVTDLHPIGACPLRGSPLELEVVTQVWGETTAEAETLDLSPEEDGRALPGRATPAAPGRHATPLRLRPRGSGEVQLSVALPPDGFPADDVFRAVVHVREKLRVDILATQAEARFLSLALNPGPQAETHIRPQLVSDLSDLSETDLVVVARTPSAPQTEHILRHHARGGGVLLFTGPETSYTPEMLRGLLGAPVRMGDVVAAPEQEPFSLSDIDTAGPPLEPFASPLAGDLLELRFTRYRSLPGADDARVLARFSDGAPAIVGTLDPDRHCLLFNSSIGERWSDAPFLPAYVPLMHRLCYDATGPVRPVWPDWFVGHVLRARVPEGAGPLATVTGPDGEVHRVGAAGGRWHFVPDRPGVYTARWRERHREATARFAANVSPLESDPTRIAGAELRQRLKAPQAPILRPEQVEEHLRRATLTRVNITLPLLVLVVLGLICETALSAPRRRRSPEETLR